MNERSRRTKRSGGGAGGGGRKGVTAPLGLLFPSEPSAMVQFAVMLRGQAPAAL